MDISLKKTWLVSLLTLFVTIFSLIPSFSSADFFGGARLGGFNPAYFIGHEDNTTDLIHVQPTVVAVMNAIAPYYYQATGEKIIITGGAEPGHSGGPLGHGAGWKLDLASTTNIQVLLPLLQQYGIAVGNEGNHYDLSFAGGGVGGTQILAGNGIAGAKAAGLGGPRETPWDVQAMMGMGNNISKVMKEFAGYSVKALGNLHPLMMNLLIALCIIDFTMMITLSGFKVVPQDIVVKVAKYGFFMYVLDNWDKFINWFFIGFVKVAGALFGYSATADFSKDVTTPQLLLQKALHLIEPALNKLASFGATDFISNLGAALVIYVFSFIVIAVFTLVALYIMLCYCELYISAAMNIVTLPFSVLHWSKFVSEGMLGHLVTATLKLVIVTVIVSMATVAFKDATVADMFSATVNAQQEMQGMPTDTGGNNYVATITQIAQQYGVDPNLAIAIASVETGGGKIDDIGSADTNIMQVLNGDQDCTLPDGTVTNVGSAFPGFETNPTVSIQAGMAVLKNKINSGATSPAAAAERYNGGGDPDYVSKVMKVYAALGGGDYSALYSANRNPHSISTEVLCKYILFCLVLIFFAFLILKLPNRIIKPLGGSVELP